MKTYEEKIIKLQEVMKKKNRPISHEEAKKIMDMVSLFGYSIFDIAYDILYDPEYDVVPHMT